MTAQLIEVEEVRCGSMANRWVEVQQFDLEDGKACNCLGVSNLLGRSAGGIGESIARWIR